MLRIGSRFALLGNKPAASNYEGGSRLVSGLPVHRQVGPAQVLLADCRPIVRSEPVIQGCCQFAPTVAVDWPPA
jgi:hypothetical protein